MEGMKRPLAVTIVAVLYIAVGLLGFIGHGLPIVKARAIHGDDVLVESMELAALVAGVFMWKGANWARWLAAAWMGFHVGLSFWETLEKLAAHAVLLALITYLLFRRDSSSYFRGAKRAES